jgi:hypothetical protein
MSDGMRIWGPDGVLQMDENSFSMRVVFTQLVSMTSASKTMQSFSVPGVTTSNAIAFVIPNGDFSDTVTQFETELLADTVRVYNYNRGFPAGTWQSTAGTMRLIVVRFA